MQPLQSLTLVGTVDVELLCGQYVDDMCNKFHIFCVCSFVSIAKGCLCTQKLAFMLADQDREGHEGEEKIDARSVEMV